MYQVILREDSDFKLRCIIWNKMRKMRSLNLTIRFRRHMWPKFHPSSDMEPPKRIGRRFSRKLQTFLIMTTFPFDETTTSDFTTQSKKYLHSMEKKNRPKYFRSLFKSTTLLLIRLSI